jgi:hypothetical protein
MAYRVPKLLLHLNYYYAAVSTCGSFYLYLIVWDAQISSLYMIALT